MATKRFKEMTAAERREQRAQARLNKKKAPVTAPRFTVADTNRGKRAAAEQRALTETETPRGYQLTPEQKAAQQAQDNDSFEEIFLSVIQFLPPEQQSRAFSLFSVFRKQTPDQQKEVIDSLMTVAKEQTGPLYNLMKERIEQDRAYVRAGYERQKNDARALYDRLVQQTDSNALRDKAKEDRNLAKTLRSITNQAFVTRVAGSGIVQRRNREQIEDASIRKDDIEIGKNQAQTSANQKVSQLERDLNARIERENALEQRDLFDTAQDQEEAARTLFLNLFENEFAQSGDVARDNIATGDVVDTGTDRAGGGVPIVGGGVNAAGVRSSEVLRQDVFSGGTDEQRRARGAEEQRVKNSVAETQRMTKLQDDIQKAVGRLFELNQYRQLLVMTNRDTTAVDAEMNRLRPVAEAQLQRARNGQGSFMNGSGSGLPDLNFYLERNAADYLNNSGIAPRYGSMNREKLISELQGRSSIVDTFGKEFVDLDKQELTYLPGTNEFYNKYGSETFDTSKKITPSTAPRTDVLAAATVAPVRPITKAPLQSGWTDGLTNQEAVAKLGDLRAGRTSVVPEPAVVTNPNTGKQYTGAAASRLAKRLAR